MTDFDDLNFCPNLHRLIADGTLPPGFDKLSREAAVRCITAAAIESARVRRSDLMAELGLTQHVETEAARRES